MMHGQKNIKLNVLSVQSVYSSSWYRIPTRGGKIFMYKEHQTIKLQVFFNKSLKKYPESKKEQLEIYGIT